MSEIIYALRSPKLMRNVIFETEQGKQFEMIVGSMSFVYQPVYYTLSKCDSGYGQYEKTMIRLENLWRGKPRPMCVAHTEVRDNHKIRVGQGVYRYTAFNGEPCLQSPHEFYTINYKNEIYVGKIVKILL